MAFLRKHLWSVWLAIGLLAGMMFSGLWPNTPLHAVSTDRMDTFAIATGFVDEGVEAVYFLDFLTGTLKAAVLSNQTREFQAIYGANITADLANVVQFKNANLQQANAQRRRNGGTPLPELQMPQSPSYMMVTGLADIRRGAMARMRPGSSIIYVAETNTGIVLAYVVPWSSEDHSANRPSGGPLTLWAGEQFTTALIRQP